MTYQPALSRPAATGQAEDYRKTGYQIVYRLYGLAEEEIRIVEGRSPGA